MKSRSGVVCTLGASVLLLGAAAVSLAAADSSSGAPAGRTITFAKEISPIFQEKCEECHRKGTAAPMSLATYEETRPGRSRSESV